jgi:hypothetical protein
MARGHVAGFEALVRNGADVLAECRDSKHATDIRQRQSIIGVAVGAAEPEFLRAMLRNGLDPDFVLSKGGNETLLYRAGDDHSEPAMQSLLDAGATINHQNAMGYSPMGSAMLRRDYKTMWFLWERGADPMVGSESGCDVPSQLKTYGSRGVWPDQREYFEKVVAELIERGLLTRQDIVEADKPKRSALDDGPPGVTVIEHAPDSEAGQAILEMDRKEREANERDRR